VLLKALGLGVAAPLARQMASLSEAQADGAPVRLFIFFLPHGFPVEHVEPLGSGGSLLGASTVLAPLQAYEDQVNVIRGLHMNGATNHEAVRAVLTGFGGGGDGDSIDYQIAQSLSVEAHCLGALPYDTWFGTSSFLIKHGGSWVRATESPFEARKALIGDTGSSEPDYVDESAFRQRALAMTEAELETLHDAVTHVSSEQTKLTDHLNAVRELKANAATTLPNGCDGELSLPAVDATEEIDVFDHANLGRLVDGHLELAAHAILCGTARVITMQNLWVNANVNMAFAGGPGIAKSHHDPLSHSYDTTGRAEFAQAQAWFYERLATKFLSVLDQPDPFDPATTALDNTLVYVCSEISDGAHHNSDSKKIWVNGQETDSYLPAITIGGAGGYLAQKGIVDVDRSHLDMLATIRQAMGVDGTTIGGATATPIGELEA